MQWSYVYFLCSCTTMMLFWNIAFVCECVCVLALFSSHSNTNIMSITHRIVEFQNVHFLDNFFLNITKRLSFISKFSMRRMTLTISDLQVNFNNKCAISTKMKENKNIELLQFVWAISFTIDIEACAMLCTVLHVQCNAFNMLCCVRACVCNLCYVRCAQAGRSTMHETNAQ